MPVNDELGKRMKHNYEEISKTRLARRTPVAIFESESDIF